MKLTKGHIDTVKAIAALTTETLATSYRQQRCPHGWVMESSCADCATREERDALKLELSKVIAERDNACNQIVELKAKIAICK